ncbi:MAG: hypothetical protein CL917_14685 [Deltaproteobacteria bacterium]|nr:hypothetical protein [Deltaproteobacteria bacterium]
MIRRSKKLSLRGARGHSLERGTAVEREKRIDKNQRIETVGRTHEAQEASSEVGAGGDEGGETRWVVIRNQKPSSTFIKRGHRRVDRSPTLDQIRTRETPFSNSSRVRRGVSTERTTSSRSTGSSPGTLEVVRCRSFRPGAVEPSRPDGSVQMRLPFGDWIVALKTNRELEFDRRLHESSKRPSLRS